MTISIIFTICLIFHTTTTAAYVYPSQCKIGFRLDDIQEYWLVDTQIAIMTKFIQRNVPLTIGIVYVLSSIQLVLTLIFHFKPYFTLNSFLLT